MPLLIAAIILAVLSATLIMLRINKNERTDTSQQEDEDNDSVIVDMFHGVEDDILSGHNN